MRHKSFVYIHSVAKMAAVQKSVSNACHNVVLVGRTGAGKSCLGNVILGRNAFEEGDYSVSTTKVTSPVETFEQGNVKINVVDTIGIDDTELSRAEVLGRIAKVVERYPGGIGLILFVFDGKLSEHEVMAFDMITQVLFPNCLDNVWLVRNRFKFANDPVACKNDMAYLTANKTPSGDVVRSLADSHRVYIPNIGDSADIAADILRTTIVSNTAVYQPPAYQEICAAIHGKSSSIQADAIDKIITTRLDIFPSNDLLRMAWQKWKQGSECSIL